MFVFLPTIYFYSFISFILQKFFMQKTHSILLLLLFALMIMAGSCTHEPEEILSSGYPTQVDSIMKISCAVSGCHDNNNTQLSLDTWENMMKGSSDLGAVTVPYNKNWSHIFAHINTFADLGFQVSEPSDLMPPNNPLAKTKVSIIQDWIMSGAKNKDGNYYWASQELKSTNKAFMLCSGSDLVAVVDIPTNRIMRYVTVGVNPDDTTPESPHFVILSPDKQYFYVSLIMGRYIEKYSTKDYSFQGRVKVGDSPSVMRLNASGTRMIVTHFNNAISASKLTLLNTETMTGLDSIVGDSEAKPHGVTANNDFSKVYITASEGNYYSKYSIVNDKFEEGDKIVLAPSEPSPQGSTAYGGYQALVSPDGTKLFISCANQNTIRVFNTANDVLLSVITTETLPRLMVYDEVTNRVFVTCAQAQNTAVQGSIRGCISVIDANGLSFIQNIWNVSHRPHGIGIDPVNRTLYVSAENTGGAEPPHHPTTGTGSFPGWYNVIDLNTLEVMPAKKTQIAGFPTSLCVGN
jgi:DNA-binding beta-propeller fold protein YncE